MFSAGPSSSCDAAATRLPARRLVVPLTEQIEFETVHRVDLGLIVPPGGLPMKARLLVALILGFLTLGAVVPLASAGFEVALQLGGGHGNA